MRTSLKATVTVLAVLALTTMVAGDALAKKGRSSGGNRSRSSSSYRGGGSKGYKSSSRNSYRSSSRNKSSARSSGKTHKNTSKHYKAKKQASSGNSGRRVHNGSNNRHVINKSSNRRIPTNNNRGISKGKPPKWQAPENRLRPGRSNGSIRDNVRFTPPTTGHPVRGIKRPVRPRPGILNPGAGPKPPTQTGPRPLPGNNNNVLPRPRPFPRPTPPVVTNPRPFPRPTPPVVTNPRPFPRPTPPITKPKPPIDVELPEIVKPRPPLKPVPLPPIVKPEPPVLKPLPPIVRPRPPYCPRPDWCRPRPPRCHWWYDWCPSIRFCAPTDCVSYSVDVVEAQDMKWYLGMTGMFLPGQGFGVESVEKDSPAAEAGLDTGMVIISVNGIQVTDTATLADAIATSTDGLLQLEVIVEAGTQAVPADVQMIQIPVAAF